MDIIFNILGLLFGPFLGIFLIYISIRIFIKIKKKRTYSEAIKKWAGMEEIGGFLGFFGILILFLGYCNATKCGLDFELRTDGYYLVMYDSEIDTHNGTTYDYPNYIDGPFTKKEINKMLDECQTPIEKFIKLIK